VNDSALPGEALLKLVMLSLSLMPVSFVPSRFGTAGTCDPGTLVIWNWLLLMSRKTLFDALT
jgi:hypothetical protein